MRFFRLPAVLIAASALAACGGGGSHAAVAPPTSGAPIASSGADLSANAPHNAAAASGAVAANVTVQIPFAASASSNARTPQYLTANTKGIDLQAYQNGTYSGYVFYALTSGQSYCTSGTTALTCKLTVQAPVGSTQILVHTYDGTTVAGSNVLSLASPAQTIVAGQTNNVTITTLPLAAKVTFTGIPSACQVVGTPSNSTMNYTAYDADGGALTGLTLGNSIFFTAVNSTDTNSGWSFTPSAITQGSGSLAFAYNGSDNNMAVYTQTNSLTPTGQTNVLIGGAAFLPVTSAGPHYVYVADSANDQIYSFDLCQSNQGNTIQIAYGLPAGTSAQKIRYDRHSPSNDPRMYVAAGNGNKLLYVDVSATSSGTAPVLQTVSYSGPVRFIADSSTSTSAFVSVGSNSLFRYSVTESGPTYLSQSGSLATLTQPRGFGLEGSGNDLIVAQNGGQTVDVNGSSMAVDQTLAIAGAPNGVSGPNASTNCALVEDNTNNLVSAVGIDAAGTSTSAQIGSSISLPGTPAGVTFFPPSTSGTGTVGIGTTTALVPTPGTGVIVSCNGTSFTQTGTYTGFFLTATGAAGPSEYASLAVPGLVYVVGSYNGTPYFVAYTQFSNVPMFSVAFPSSAVLTSVTSGP